MHACSPPLPVAAFTSWDLVVRQNETADAQQLRSHVHHLWDNSCLERWQPTKAG